MATKGAPKRATKPKSSSSLPSIAELDMKAAEAKPETVPSYLSRWPAPTRDKDRQRMWKIRLANGDEYSIYPRRFDGVRRWVATSKISGKTESVTQPYASTHTLALKAILKRVKPLERYELEAVATIERIMKESGKTLEQLMRQARRK